MECIYCGKQTKVTNSRPQIKDHQTWRRRKCLACHATVTSVESYTLEDALRVEKKNGTYQQFYRDKLFVSILMAVEHLPEPVITANSLTATVLRHILSPKPLDPLVSSKTIAKQTSIVLRRFNAAAAVRYMSYQDNLQLPNDVRRTLK